MCLISGVWPVAGGVCRLVYVLDRKTALRRKIRIAVCCEIAYLMFLLVSVPYGMVFSVSVDNMYSRGPAFLHICHHVFGGNFVSFDIYDHHSQRISESQQDADLSIDSFCDG